MTSGNENLRLAVIMTCHNRIAITTDCLKALKKQKPFGASIDLFLVDDGSTDGTALAVSGIWPDATIIQGDGSLYWCGGMRIAFAQAMQKDYDYYLWLNDDTHLGEDALYRIFRTFTDASLQLGNLLIVVGSTCERESGTITYGGWRQRAGKLFSISWEIIEPQMKRWITCDTMNGNCVLIPRTVVEKIGNLDDNFSHSMGDFDYGLRARKNGCQIVLAPGYYGACSANNGAGLWVDDSQPIIVRWKKLLGPKGLPIKPWMIFCHRHKGHTWVLVWLSPYFMFWVNEVLRLFRVNK